MKRYRWTGKIPTCKRESDTLSGGWTTTDLLLEGMRQAQALHVDRCFTFRELVAAVREVMARHHLAHQGFAGGRKRYRDGAARVVHSRFGDLHRSGVLAPPPGPNVVLVDFRSRGDRPRAGDVLAVGVAR